MIVDVVIEKRFYQCQEGHIWTENAFPFAFWQRYLSVFDQVNIIARVHHTEQPGQDWKQVTGERVTMTMLPGYVGPLQLLKALPRTIKILRRRRDVERRMIYRIPSILAWLYHIFARGHAKVYGAEVVGDPADTFARQASRHPLRPFIRYFFVTLLRRQCRQAFVISYVTQHALQKRYPPNEQALSTYYSSIQLADKDFNQPIAQNWSAPLQLLCIGNLSQPYKGCDIMLQAISMLREKQVDCHLTWVGGGALLDSMLSLASSLNVDKYVNFVGNVAEREVMYDYIDKTDIFVLSSLQEGLPRVLIESMARGKFCIATNVGGVNELLPEEWIVEPGSAHLLANAISKAIRLTTEQAFELRQMHFESAQAYHDSQLQIRREKLFRTLLEAPQ